MVWTQASRFLQAVQQNGTVPHVNQLKNAIYLLGD